MKRCLRFVVPGLTMLFAVFVLSACSIWETSPAQERFRRITIDENDRTCVSANECVLTGTDCSSCECGTPINRQHAAKYEQAYKQACMNYRGPVCDMACPEVTLECINNLCMAVEKGD